MFDLDPILGHGAYNLEQTRCLCTYPVVRKTFPEQPLLK